MKLLEEKIKKDGVMKSGGVLKVDSFLNHQIDVDLLNEIGREFRRLFPEEVTKILTVEASGISIACITAQYFQVPVLFAKKSQSKNLDGEIYTSKVHSYTHNQDYIIRVSKKYLNRDDKVLIIDDFLAKGKALMGLMDIVDQAGAELIGCGICIEKSFQEGGRIIRDKGVKLESLARVNLDQDGNIYFE